MPGLNSSDTLRASADLQGLLLFSKYAKGMVSELLLKKDIYEALIH
jgi:hypothetical protein